MPKKKSESKSEATSPRRARGGSPKEKELTPVPYERRGFVDMVKLIGLRKFLLWVVIAAAILTAAQAVVYFGVRAALHYTQSQSHAEEEDDLSAWAKHNCPEVDQQEINEVGRAFRDACWKLQSGVLCSDIDAFPSIVAQIQPVITKSKWDQFLTDLGNKLRGQNGEVLAGSFNAVAGGLLTGKSLEEPVYSYHQEVFVPEPEPEDLPVTEEEEVPAEPQASDTQTAEKDTEPVNQQTPVNSNQSNGNCANGNCNTGNTAYRRGWYWWY